ncbi:MAG: hypothetical protein IJK05_04665 [Bacteroidales bacterium]|nr:hypothetical protein [Bacteroidales bacterium]
MGNIDDKTISALLARIDGLKAELSLLEEDIKALTVPVVRPFDELTAAQAHQPDDSVPEPIAPVPEPIAPVPEPVEGVEGPVEEEVPVELVVDDDMPIDITISDIDIPVPDAPVPEPVEGGEGPVETKKPILDTAKADTAVMDVMADKQAWRTDRPGMPVKNIISAISLNDRVLLINDLFGEDPLKFQDTIAKFNSMTSLSEALEYIAANYPGWDMNSETVYRFMMAVRRKLS